MATAQHETSKSLVAPSSPILPLELEREIFELAAQERGRIPALLRVARRVHTWIQPLLFRVIRAADTRTWTRFLQTAQSTPELIAKNLRFLCIDNNISSADYFTVISTMQRIEDLVLPAFGLATTGTTPLSELAYLRRLAGSPAHLRLAIGSPGARFPSLTHLELMDLLDGPARTNAQYDSWKALMLVPTLTHLSNPNPDHISWSIVQKLLEDMPGLTMLMAVYSEDDAWRYFHEINAGDIRDNRFLAGTYVNAEENAWREWERAANGVALDYWDRADAFLERKRKGAVHATRRWVDDWIYEAEEDDDLPSP
ncbi:hypothetical protein MKEN_00945500 [Mycena kentingensis (nom. inval.)]|nr:hypothetical protein MKEN_00945500 [Mycena kentingensis (nom. inval.)]